MEHLAGQYFLNSDLREEEIRTQIQQLCDAGYESIHLHARAGLKTPYLSEPWFEALNIAVEELIKHNVKFAIWDEDNFPSGDVGNVICTTYPELASSYLDFKIIETVPKEKVTHYFSIDSAFLGCFAIYNDGQIENLQNYCGTLKESWNNSRIQSSAYSLQGQLPYPHRRRSMNTSRYAVVYTPQRECKLLCIELKRKSPGNHSGDLLNIQTTQTLLALTHQKYENFFKDKLKYCSGSFIDEPSVADIYPWTRALPHEFTLDHNYDILENLPHLYLDINHQSIRIRNDYRKTIHRLVCQNYLTPIKEWLNKRNINSVGHLSRSENLVYSPIFWPNQLRCFKYLDIPCCDPLGYGVGQIGSTAHHIGTKIVSSSARLFGKQAAGADAFAVGGDTISLSDIKFSLNYHLAMGITWYNVHGLYYTLEGERRDEAPPSLFYQHSQWPHMKAFLDYLKEYSKKLSGEHYCNLEFLYPSTALQSHLLSLPNYAQELHDTAEELLANQKDFELIDEETLLEQNIQDFVKQRPCFLVAYASVITQETATYLETYVSNGGQLIVTGMIPKILPSLKDSEINEWGFAKQYFTDDFVSKIPGLEIQGENSRNILIRQVINNNEIKTFLFNRSTKTFYGKVDNQSIEIAPGSAGFIEELTPQINLPKLQIDNWQLSFDLNCVPLNYWENSPLSAIDLLTQNNVGALPIPENGEYYCIFTTQSPLEKLVFTTEEETLKNAEFFLNGIALTNYQKANFRDCRELECNITTLLRSGRNTLVCRGELMNNSPYLRGTFKAEFPLGNFGYPVLSQSPKNFELKSLKDYRNLGYGTFSGTAKYSCSTCVEQSATYLLDLALVKDSVRIYVDNKVIDTIIAPPYKISIKLSKGLHNITLEVCNAPGNRDIMAGVPAGLQD